ncbi:MULTISPECIES: NAD(P)-dependent oxidoreductase [unclassified Streptomyces]|uniref:NAD(P)-dependent oxidoreductase n=1 Tax=unclassified Streptomyces TaxID=2593676 RepID=UPI0036EB2C95
MQITLLGATGPTGQQVLIQALKGGHSVTALVRDPSRLPQRGDSRVTVITGDATVARDIEGAVAGSDVVISALGPGKDFTSTLATRTTAALLPAMAKSKAERLVWLSALGAGNSSQQQSVVQATASKLLMGKLMADKGVADDKLVASGLNCTIVLPVMLTNGPHTATCTTIDADTRTGRVGGKISRADVADYLLGAATGKYEAKGRIILTR